MEVSTVAMVYVALVNSIALLCMGGDKFFAASSEKRIPEGVLFFLAVIGGSPAVLAGMFLFRHKTRKWYFLIGLPLLLLQQLFLLQQYGSF